MSLSYIQMILPALLQGTVQTLIVFALTLVFSVPLGLPIALGSMSKIWPVKAACQVYVWLFRGTPLMLQLFFFYFGIPIALKAAGIESGFWKDILTMDRMEAAVVTFALNYSAYFSEIYRAGIQSIDKGQYEASQSLGFSKSNTMRYIILPQTFRRIIPPMSNEVITLIKDTALVTAIGVPELLKATKDAASRDVNPTAYVVAAAIYLLLTFFLTVLSHFLEKRFSRSSASSSV